MSEKEYQWQSEPIHCLDSEGGRHTIFEIRLIRETVYLDNSTDGPTILRSDWCRLSEGYGKPIEKFVDSETGDTHFRCPDLDGLVLIPKRPIQS